MTEKAVQSNLESRFIAEISKRVVGREDVVKLMLVSLLSQGHILLQGNLGLGKTTLAKAFSETIGGVSQDTDDPRHPSG